MNGCYTGFNFLFKKISPPINRHIFKKENQIPFQLRSRLEIPWVLSPSIPAVPKVGIDSFRNIFFQKNMLWYKNKTSKASWFLSQEWSMEARWNLHKAFLIKFIGYGHSKYQVRFVPGVPDQIFDYRCLNFQVKFPGRNYISVNDLVLGFIASDINAMFLH